MEVQIGKVSIPKPRHVGLCLLSSNRHLQSPGGKQVYLGCVPPVANLVEDPFVERLLHLDNLIVTGQFVCYHIQPARNMAHTQDNVL